MQARTRKKPIALLVLGIILCVYMVSEFVRMLISRQNFLDIQIESAATLDFIIYLFLLSIGIVYWVFSLVTIFLHLKTILIIMGIFHCVMNIRAFSNFDLSAVSIIQFSAFGLSIAYLIIACCYKEFEKKESWEHYTY